MIDRLQRRKVVELQKEDAPKYLIDELKRLIQQEAKALQARSQQPLDEAQISSEKMVEILNSNNKKRESDCERQNVILGRLQEIIDEAYEAQKRKWEEEEAAHKKRLEELKKEEEEDRLWEARRDKEDEENARRKKERKNKSNKPK